MRRVLLTIGTVKALALGAYAAALRGWQLRWGATADEVGSPLPGDELIPVAQHCATRAISIDARADQVWPWLAQLGQGRGGFYSYDRLENLAGCEVTSAEEIVLDWQDVAVGDDFRLHPEITLTVARVDPPHALVVAGLAPSGETGAGAGGAGAGGAPYDFSWAFVLVERPDLHTRLVVRERYGYRTPWAPLMVELLSVISFLMTQRMLRGIRDRAEARVGH